jgi:hypothetical protein
LVGIATDRYAAKNMARFTLYVGVYIIVSILVLLMIYLTFQRVVLVNFRTLTSQFRKNIHDQKGVELLRKVEHGDEIEEMIEGMEGLSQHLFETDRQLKEYAADLERKVEQRTAQLSLENDIHQKDLNMLVSVLGALRISRTRPELWRNALPLLANRFLLVRASYICMQEGEIRPVGSTKTLATDVRIVASTNRSLEKKVTENSFRADLFYRLNVIAIRMPPLRERSEDIALLARFFLEKALAEMNLTGMSIEPEVLSYLSLKDWPGNVRELQNTIKRLVVFSGRENITMTSVQRIEATGQPPNPGAQDELGPYKSMKSLVTDRFSRNYIERLLTATSGNVSEASRISGLSRVAIQKLGQRLGIDPGRFR